MTAPRYRWQPTTAEIAARFGLRTNEVVRFDQNTSPFSTDWAPGLIGPLAQGLNEYPAASYGPLRAAAAEYLDADPRQIVPGAGIDEIILLVAKAYLGPGTRSTAAVPTYPLYEIATRQLGGEFVPVPCPAPGFEVPLDALSVAAETSDVTWLCIPNNPTGHRMGDLAIMEIVESARGVVVIDAAYAEFTEDRWSPWVQRYDNVIVCHTMSKGFGLAALRVGFALASPTLADELDGLRPPGSIASLSAEIATSALATPTRMRRHVDRIVRERSRFSEALADSGMVISTGSVTNFILCEVGPHAEALADALMAEGLVVRRFPADGPLGNHLRFTVRARGENDRLIEAIRRHS